MNICLSVNHINRDNNFVENVIRPLALSRKNFLFCGNHEAAKTLRLSVHCLPPARRRKSIQENY
ncbi:hypothetical protein DWZ09_06575 [Bacteroides cellulosilyticus]|nr:hypothetical protein DWZ09_06575 [Bacteroides cellulosilyticus]